MRARVVPRRLLRTIPIMPDPAPLSTSHLDAYFARIHYPGPREPTLATLRSILFHHTTNIPFENLSILQARGVSIDPLDIHNKLVTQRRGGYCFEQNTLLLHVLTALGFAVEPLSARVRLQLPRDITPPRTHLFNRVTIDGTPWLADAGVGGFSPTAPIRLDTTDPQTTSHNTHRVIHEDGRFFHQTLIKHPNNPTTDPTTDPATDPTNNSTDNEESWSDVYEFTGEPMPLIDRAIANWWTSTCPESKFSKSLMAAMAHADGTRVGVMNRAFIRRRESVVIESRDIASPSELLTILHREFGLSFNADTRFGNPGSDWPS